MSQRSRALVVGYGSIGERHARVLAELGCDVAVVSRRAVDHPRNFSELRAALDMWNPDYVVVASRTHEHYEALAALAEAGFAGKVLVEKPLFAQVTTPPPARFSLTAVAYNLRFHPLLVKLKNILDSGERIITASIYVGQYLPQWRPDANYKRSYSARRQEGGGVLRDISHELDYVSWLFGRWERLSAVGGHFSDLEIDSDDCYSVLMVTSRCPAVSIHMNYLDRVARREIIINTVRHTLRADLVHGVLDVDGNQQAYPAERDVTYRREHQAMLAGDASALCDLDSGVEVMDTIAAIEKANASETWIAR